MSLEHLLQDEQDLLALYIEEEMREMHSFSLEYWLTQEPPEDYVDSYKSLVGNAEEEEYCFTCEELLANVPGKGKGGHRCYYLSAMNMRAQDAWDDLQAVPSYVERDQRARQFCEHGQYRSLCPECSPLA